MIGKKSIDIGTNLFLGIFSSKTFFVAHLPYSCLIAVGRSLQNEMLQKCVQGIWQLATTLVSLTIIILEGMAVVTGRMGDVSPWFEILWGMSPRNHGC